MQWYRVCLDKSIGKELVPRRCDAFDLEHRIPKVMDLAETEGYTALNCTEEGVDVSMLEFRNT